MPVSDSVTVTTAPLRMARISAVLIADHSSRWSELGLEGHRQVGEGFAEPFLLQLREAACLLLLGDEAIEVLQQFGVALGDGPGRARPARYRLADLEHLRLLGHQRHDVDDAVDDVIDAAERVFLIGFWFG